MKSKTVFFVALLASILGGGLTFVASHYLLEGANNKYVESSSTSAFDDDAKVVFTSLDGGKEFPDLTYAAEKSVPAVVGIENKQRAVERESQYYGGGGYDPFFELFGFRGAPQQQQRQQQPQKSSKPRTVSGGSGVVISKDGYIITNNHVVDGADELTVKLSDDRKYKAKLIGTDPTTDIALLKIEAEDLPYLPFGDSEKLRLGQWVLAIGNPYQLTSTVTAGIVSAKGRNLDVIPSQFRIESFIQTDAAVNPGNSGGALVNEVGELVGINTVIKSPTGSYTGYSFAVPSSIVRKVIMDLKEFGVVQRALIGIEYAEINDDFLENRARELGVTEKSGLYVAAVTKGGAAQEAGIKEGDVVVEFNSKKITHSPALQEQIAKLRPGDKVEIGVKRDGKLKHFELVLRNRVGETKLLEKNSVDMVSFLGGEFAEVDSKLKRKLDISNGVQVVSLGDGLLKQGGIKEGYIILSINGIEIDSVADLAAITQKVRIIEGVYPNGRFISYSIINE